MKKIIPLGSCLGILLSITQVFGSPLISAGRHYMLNTNQQRLIPIMVSSASEDVEGLILAVQIGDGGVVNSGSNTAPQIVDLDITGPGTIFNASNTGSSLQYLGNLIAMDETTTASGDLEANGILAWLTVNPNGAALGSYHIEFQNVGENVDGGPWTTDFAGVLASFNSSNDWIEIIGLHQMKWNAASNGNWTNATWTGSPPPFPNYTANAVVDTSYTVNVTSTQEANSLALSSGGKVSLGSTGSLAITADVTVSTGSMLSIAPGATVSATGVQLNGGLLAGNGTISPAVSLNSGTLYTPLSSYNLILAAFVSGPGSLTKTGSGTATLSDNASYTGNTIISAGRLQLNGANSTLHAITGAGTLEVGNGVTPSFVSADSVQLGTLTIAPGSQLSRV